MEQANKAMMKALKSYADSAVLSAVLKLSEKYNFVAGEASEYLGALALSEASALEKPVKVKAKAERGRPEKAVKAVLNKDVLVEDVIERLFAAAEASEASGASGASGAVVVEASATPSSVVSETPAAEAPKKKVTKKKAESETEGAKKKAAPNKKAVEAENGPKNWL